MKHLPLFLALHFLFLSGYLLGSDEEECRFDNILDRYRLSKYAFYPDHEPPELQKTK